MVSVPRIPPPAAAVGAALLQRALSPEARPPTRVRAAGAATLAVASFSIAGAAASRFRRSGTTLEPVHPDRASVLVTDGVNTISRNPMYLGLFLDLVADVRAGVAGEESSPAVNSNHRRRVSGLDLRAF